MTLSRQLTYSIQLYSRATTASYRFAGFCRVALCAMSAFGELGGNTDRLLLMLPTKNGQSYQALVDASKASGAT